MSRRLPNLNQLRAFESAARHGSFKKAAEELNVTQAAVSHQIKALEKDLGFPLFHRFPRRVKLTKKGERLLPGLTSAFEGLAGAVSLVRDNPLEGELRISVPPFFWDRILMPRLAKFHAKHPKITVTPSPEARQVDLSKTEFDAAIRYGDGDWEGLHAIRLHETGLIPVAAATLVDGFSLPMSAAEVALLPLGALRGQEQDWRDWLALAGYSGEPAVLKSYVHGTRIVDLAFSGHCAALISTMIISEDIKAGRLVCLNPTMLESPRSMHMVYPAGGDPDPRLSIFTDWLAEELATIKFEV